MMTVNNKRSRQVPKYRLTSLLASVFLIPLLLPATLHAQGGVEDPLLQSWIKEEVPRITGDVDPYEGRLVVSADEVVIPGNGGLDLVVRRVYQHEQLGNTNRGLMLNGFNHWEFGLGWKLAFMPRIRQTMFGGVTSPSQLCSSLQSSYALSLLLPDGRQDVLYVNPANLSEAFTQSGWKFACVSGAVFVYSPNGLRYDMGTFARGNVEDGILATDFYATRVTDPNGNWIATAYQEPYPSSGLTARVPTSVTTSDGRTLQFSYNAQGRVTQISGPNGAVWTYEYRALPPSLLAPSGGYAALAKVNLPNGQTHEYDYYEPGDRQWPNQEEEVASMYRLESITGVHGGTATYTYAWQQIGQHLYDDEHYEGFPPGAPTPFTSYSRVSRKTTSDGGVWTYAYAPSLTVGQYDVTTVTGPSATTVYKYIGRTYSASTPGNPGLLGVPPDCGLMNAMLSRIGLLAEKHVASEYSEVYQWTDVRLTWLANFVHRGRPLGATWQQAPGACQQGVFLPILARRTVTMNGAQYVTEHLAHDIYGNPTSIRETGPNGGSRTTTRSYYFNALLNIRNRLDDETIQSVGSIVREWDSLGRLSSETAFGVATAYTYTAAGDVASITRPGDKVTSYSQYKRGIAQAEAQPEGITVSRSVNDLGHVTSATDGEGHTRFYGYDALGRPTLIDLPAGNDTVISYTRTSQTVTRGPLVAVTTVDGFGRPIETNRGGIVTTYRYDPLGRLIFESNPGSTVGRSYQYDALGRVIRATNADDSYRSFTYGAASVRLTDERLNATTYHFRAYGNPNKRHLVRVDAATPAASVVIVRGAHDLIESVTQAGITRSFSYDTRQYLMSETHPELGTVDYGRDAAGNMTSRTVGGVQTTYSYDGLNRLVDIFYPSGTPSITHSYSKTSRLKSVTSAAAARQMDYDLNDNLITETLSVDGRVLQAQYGYNANDQLSSITYPVSARVVNYAPNALGRPTQVSGYATSVSYWPSGQIRQVDYANGVVSTYEQNPRLWPGAFSTRRGSVYSINSTYGYDGVGNVTSIVDAVDSTRNRTLGYDAIDRLTSAAGPWGSGTIGYDGAGNITSQNLGSFNLSYSYDAQNRLGSVSGNRSASYSYDGFGNVTSAGGATYVYDAVPNMRCANCGAGNRTDYTYDGARNRVKVVKSGVTTYEFHAANGDLLVEYTPSQANRLVEYIYLDGKRLAQRISDQNAPTTITPIATTVTANQFGAVVIGANVGGTSPSGTVAFAKQGTVLGTAQVLTGSASVEVSGLGGGVHTLTATYSGDATNYGNTLTFELTVVVPPPGVPSSISVPATNSTGTFKVSWGSAAGSVEYYQLYYATNAAFTGQGLAYQGTGLTVTLSRSDGTYYYRVRACNASGCSDYLPGANPVVVTKAPWPPDNIGVPTSSSTGSYSIIWSTYVGTVTAYELYEATNASFSGQSLVYIGTGTSAALSGRGNGTYYYRVRTCNTVGCSLYREGMNALTVLLPPGAPISISVPSISYSGSYTVSWGTGSGAISTYEVYEANNSSFSGEGLIYNGGGTSVALSGRANGSYYYRVRACNASGCSAFVAGANGVTVSTVQAAVSSTSWNWRRMPNGNTIVSPNVVVTATGGSGTGYTYAWQYVSGDTEISVVSPTSNSTRWSRTMPNSNVSFSAVWRCLVTDSVGGTVYSPSVTVTFTRHTNQ